MISCDNFLGAIPNQMDSPMYPFVVAKYIHRALFKLYISTDIANAVYLYHFRMHKTQHNK